MRLLIAMAAAAWAVVSTGTLAGEVVPHPRFKPVPCAQGLADDARARLRCGIVKVPARYDDHGRGAFDIAVAVVGAQQPRSGLEPILVLHGGPGGALVDEPQPWMRSPLNVRHDLILVDQRGGGRSRPVVCPELISQRIRVIASDLSGPAEAQAIGAADRACLKQLSASLYGPAAFGTSEVARDMEMVRRALGIGRWNVYGVSYGTTVAMTLMAQFPAPIRSVILDSPYPPDQGASSEVGNFARALEQLFRACRQSAECSSQFPDLAETFHQTVASLDREPLVIGPVDGQFPRQRFVMNASDFLMMVFQLIYSRDMAGLLPHIISAVHDRESDQLRPLVEAMFSRMQLFNFGAHLAIECRDRPRFRAPEAEFPTRVPSSLRGFTFFRGHYAACPGWGTLDASPILPAGSRLPTLVLSGGLDPVTPPANAERVAAALPASQLVMFSGVGHGVVRSLPCAAEIAVDFLRQPGRPLDRSCIARVPPVPFVGDIAALPQLSLSLQRVMAGGAPPRLTALAGAALLSLAWLIWRLASVVRYRWTKRPLVLPSQPGRGAILAANALVLFNVAALAAAIVWTAGHEQVVLAFGLPAAAKPLFVLPWIIGALAVWGVIGAIKARRVTGLAGSIMALIFAVAAGSLGLAGL